MPELPGQPAEPLPCAAPDAPQQLLDALRVSEERFRSAFDNASIGFAIADLNRRLIQVNPQYCELTGYSEDELIGRDFADITHPEDRDANQDHMDAVVSGRLKASRFEKRYIRKGGDVIWVQLSVSAIHDARGRPCQTLALCHDITERKEAENVVRESEERFRIVSRATNDVIWDWDIRSGDIWWNEAVETTFGYRPEELTLGQRGWINLIHPDDRASFQSGLAEALQSGAFRWTGHYRLRRKDGTFAHVLDRGYVIRDAVGRAVRMVGTITDMTEHARAEESLRRSEELYRFLFHGSPLPMWIYDVETLAFLEVNLAAIAHYGYSKQEFLSRTIADIRPPEDIPRLMALFRSGQPISDRSEMWRHVKKDGTIIHVEVTGRPINFNGRPARLVLANDVTERMTAQEKIAEQAALLDETSDAIILTDTEERVRFWNRGAEQLYGWSQAEAQGSRIAELLHHDLTATQAISQQVERAGAWQGELTQTAKSGRQLIVLGRCTLVRDSRGVLRGALWIYTDITEKKRLEAQFLRAQRLESIGTLAGGIAHDLNNVLAPIIMGMDLLRLSITDAEGLKLLETIQNTAKRGSHLIRQVLSFARGLDGKRVPVDLESLLHEVERILADTFPKNIRLHVRPAPGGSKVIGDPTQLHQVLINLCVNARDAMPQGGQLDISTSTEVVDGESIAGYPEPKPGAYRLISVSDTGMGIPESHRDRIFDPFFTTKEIGKGTGLGLATVLAIVKGHGGFIQVQSELNQGTTFRVFLPACDGGGQAEPSLAATGSPRGRGETVLVIEDEPSVRVVTTQTLEAFGYKVLAAADGAEAIQLHQTHKDDIRVVLTDLMMPGMDGAEAIRILRARDPRLKIIATSGIGVDSSDHAQPLEGVDHFLAKPYTAPTLLAAIQGVLDPGKQPAPH
jgi:two-component system cell cycle sensor histidine kinase/response regulator CckA